MRRESKKNSLILDKVKRLVIAGAAAVCALTFAGVPGQKSEHR